MSGKWVDEEDGGRMKPIPARLTLGRIGFIPAGIGSIRQAAWDAEAAGSAVSSAASTVAFSQFFR